MYACVLCSLSNLSVHWAFCMAVLYICSCTHMTVCLCLYVYIKQPLTAIGGGGGPAGVFALAAIQHSTFLCDIQYCDLRKPALQRLSLSLFLSLTHTFPLFLCSLTFSPSLLPPPHFSLCFPLSPSSSWSFSPAYFSYSNLGNHHSLFPSLLLSKSFRSTVPLLSDRDPLTRHLSQCFKLDHTSHCCQWEVTTLPKCPGHSMFPPDAYFSFSRTRLHTRQSEFRGSQFPCLLHCVPFFGTLKALKSA